MEKTHVELGVEGLTLDILGQADRINRLYTQLTLCFPIQDDSPGSRAELVDNLERGLARLSDSFPWTAGSVVQDEGGFKIITTGTALSLVVKELQDHDEVPSWDELKRANFPFRMLDEDTLAPCRTMVEPEADRPVLMVQANFVRGGLLLTVNAQHGSMDMAGQGQIITLFAKACRGESFTKDEVEIGNMKRTGWIPLSKDETANHRDLESSKPGREETTENVAAKSSSHGESSGSPSSDLVWAYLEFPAASLSSLKHLASQTLNTLETTFVSTDDVLTAFIWKSITRARQPRVNSPRSPKTTLTRNVDIRQHFHLPPTYPGLMTTSTTHQHTIDDIAVHLPLGAVASNLRAALSPALLRESAEAQASIIARSRDAAAQKSTAALSDPRFDVRLSSWAKEKLCDLDFGPWLGRAGAVRRPKFGGGAREGLVYFLPKGRDGSVMVGICLREEDMGRLRVDEEVVRWSTWVG